MKELILPRIVCPISKEKLVLEGEERDGAEIVGGLLRSQVQAYPIMNGVPCLLTTDQQIDAKDGFTSMWRYRQEGKFERTHLYGITPERKAQWVAEQFRQPILPGEWVLDAGCGSAETTFALARMYPSTNFVGLDFSDAVRVSAEGSAELPNLFFLQGDIAHPPLVPMQFDHVFSLGVLHHTPDTAAAFRGAADMVKPGGELLVWLYPAAKESFMARQLYYIRDYSFFGKGHEIPPELRYKMAKLYSVGMMPAMTAAYTIYKGLSKLGGKDEHKVLAEDLTLRELFNTTAFAIYDNITPKYQHRHGKDEVAGWYKEAGFGNTQTDNAGTFIGRSDRPASAAKPIVVESAVPVAASVAAKPRAKRVAKPRVKPVAAAHARVPAKSTRRSSKTAKSK